MMVLCVADTHGTMASSDRRWLNQIKNEYPIELIVCLGDIYTRDFNIINSVFPNVRKVGVLGNHDSFEALIDNNITSIHNNIVTVNGISFGGFGGSIKYKNAPMPLLTDEESCRAAESLAAKGRVDVFVTHDIAKNNEKDFAHSGLEGIQRFIDTYQPLAHLHGHIHEKEDYYNHQTKTLGIYGFSILNISQHAIEEVWYNEDFVQY